MTLSTTSVATLPTISDLTTWVVGQFNATGSRISLPLSLSPVGRVGDSLVDWDVTLPNASTTFGIDVSPDGINWTDVSADNGLSIPFIQGMQDPPFIDSFAIDNSANYTQGNINTPGGAPATWNVSTNQSQVIAIGGTHAFFSPNGQMMGDGEIYVDSDRCGNGGGVIWALSSDYGTCYELAIQDGSSTGSPNTMRLYKVIAGNYTQLGNGVALSFTRTIPQRFKIVQSTGVITITTSYPVTTPDGAVVAGNTQTLTYTDTSPLAPGGVALRSNGGTSHYSYLVIRAYGEDETNESLYTRVRLGQYRPNEHAATTGLDGKRAWANHQ